MAIDTDSGRQYRNMACGCSEWWRATSERCSYHATHRQRPRTTDTGVHCAVTQSMARASVRARLGSGVCTLRWHPGQWQQGLPSSKGVQVQVQVQVGVSLRELQEACTWTQRASLAAGAGWARRRAGVAKHSGRPEQWQRVHGRAGYGARHGGEHSSRRWCNVQCAASSVRCK